MSVFVSTLDLKEEMRKSTKNPCSLWLACAMLFLLVPRDARPQSRSVSVHQSSSQEGQDHFLLLYNTHTAERIDIVYRHGEQYVPAALAKLDYFLRDHRTGEIRHFDPHLYDILSDLTASVGFRARRSTSSAVIALREQMNRFVLVPQALPKTAFTFRRKQLICACTASTPSSCAARL
jgi:Bacterial protein of unknown function (DUF882)